MASTKSSAKLDALRIKQGSTTLYLTYLRARDFMDGLTDVDAWSPTNKQGYQRMPVQSRFRKIARYVTGKDGNPRPVLPQAVVLNARAEDSKKLRFTGAGENGVGTLEIPEGVKLWEVDGQHRLGGLRYAVGENAEFGDFPIPIVITEGLPRLDEAVLFFVVNTTQKRVATDLAQRLIEQQMGDASLRLQIVAEGKDWIPKATRIVDIMVNTPGNPWHAKIGIPGTQLSGILMKQVSFVTSLKPVLNGGLYGSVPPEDVAQLLIRYWQALQEIYPEAFENPDEHVIQNTVGVFPLHILAPTVFDMVRSKNGRITKDAIAEVIKELAQNLSKDYDQGSTFWHSKDGEAGKYAGAKGFRLLAEILKEHMPELKKMQLV